MSNEFNNKENTLEREKGSVMGSEKEMEETIKKELEEKALKKAEDRKFIREDHEGRSRYTRVFETRGGEKAAVLYPEPVHMEKDGKWVPIDNTLVYSDKEDFYENKENELKVRLSGKADTEELISAERNGFCMSWSVLREENFFLRRQKESRPAEKRKLPSGI